MAEMSESEREELAKRVATQRRIVFGAKSAAYRAASISPTTWNRIEAGESVREDSLISAIKALWPRSEGDWTRIEGVADVDLTHFDFEAEPGEVPPALNELFARVADMREKLDAVGERLTAVERQMSNQERVIARGKGVTRQQADLPQPPEPSP